MRQCPHFTSHFGTNVCEQASRTTSQTGHPDCHLSNYSMKGPCHFTRLMAPSSAVLEVNCCHRQKWGRSDTNFTRGFLRESAAPSDPQASSARPPGPRAPRNRLQSPNYTDYTICFTTGSFSKADLKLEVLTECSQLRLKMAINFRI